jgi:transcriptional regulator with XRE-family HTH domain
MDVQTVLENAKRLIEDSGLTYQQVGKRMGYPPKSARQSVWKFLNCTNPSIPMLVRFATAMGVEARELL